MGRPNPVAGAAVGRPNPVAGAAADRPNPVAGAAAGRPNPLNPVDAGAVERIRKKWRDSNEDGQIGRENHSTADT